MILPISSGSRPTSWDMGECCGIKIHIHYTFPLYILYRVSGGFLHAGRSSRNSEWNLLFNIVSVVILFGTVLVHEFGHSAMALKIGGTVEKILLWPFGGLAYCAFSREPKKQLAVSLAGPLTHFPMAGIWYLVWWLVTDPHHCARFSLFGPMYNLKSCFFSIVALEAFRMQIMLCAFNLLFPVYPLDGGKIFLTILIMCCKTTPPTAAKICIGVSTTLCSLLMLFSVVHMNWFSFLLCLWIMYQIYNMYTYLRSGRISEHPLFEHAPGGFYNPVAQKVEAGGGIRLRSINY